MNLLRLKFTERQIMNCDIMGEISKLYSAMSEEVALYGRERDLNEFIDSINGMVKDAEVQKKTFTKFVVCMIWENYKEYLDNGFDCTLDELNGIMVPIDKLTLIQMAINESQGYKELLQFVGGR